MKGITRALLVIGTWAFVYALPAVPLEGLPNIGVRLPSWAYEVDMWPQTLAIPGIIASLVFMASLLATRRFGDFERVAAGRLAGWGAFTGIVAGAIVLAVIGGEALNVSIVIVTGAALLGAAAAPTCALVLRYLAGRKHGAADARA